MFADRLLALKLLRGSHIIRKQDCIEKILVGVGVLEQTTKLLQQMLRSFSVTFEYSKLLS